MSKDKDTFAALSTEVRLERSKVVVGRLIDLAIEVLRQRAHILAMRNAPLFTTTWQGTDGVTNALTELRHHHYSYFIVRLSSLWDQCRKDRYSIPTLAQLVKNGEMQQKLFEQEKSLYPHDLQRSERAQAPTKQHLQDFLGAVGDIESRYRNTLRHVRDGHLAHNLAPDHARGEGVTNVLRKDIEDLLNESIQCLEMADFSIRQSCFDWIDYAAQSEKRATALWNGLTHPMMKT